MLREALDVLVKGRTEMRGLWWNRWRGGKGCGRARVVVKSVRARMKVDIAVSGVVVVSILAV